MKTTTITATLLLVLLAACTQPGITEDVEWSCVQYQCANYGTGVAWAEQNCQTTENGTYCPIVQDGEEFLVPIQNINLSAVQDQQLYCEEYRCVREAPSRAVNYTVETNN